jgi:RimJ/RimL family protein N-acetyltransferase
VAKIELHVFPHNVAALNLYDQLGYRRVGCRRAHFRRSDGLVDAILMEKTL